MAVASLLAPATALADHGIAAAVRASGEPLAAPARHAPASAGLLAQVTSTPGSLELIGHSPLLNRGMNAAPAVKGDYAYIGSRTDGTHLNAGVLVVDVSDPASPQEELDGIGFLEGNSNVGDSRALERYPGRCARGRAAPEATGRERLVAPATAPAYPRYDFGSEELQRD
jgi:hypothetical protein